MCRDTAAVRRGRRASQGATIPFAASRNGQNKVGWFSREPVGIVAALTSFNDPLNLVAHKLGPALIAGNGVVLKPSRPHSPSQR